MRKLCLGGSFNPIHHGHLLSGLAAVESLGFDRLVLIPSAVPPLKQMAADMASAADRLAMCNLAAAGVNAIEVDGIELERTRPSFTIDTARQLRQRGWENVSWLIGADALESLPRWHELSALLREVNFIVMARPGWTIDWQNLPVSLRQLEDSTVQIPQIQISATQIRMRVRDQLPIAFMTPPAVCEYIREHGLYRATSSRH
jgi:nicotinate-nucleotide adenylyltransferase